MPPRRELLWRAPCSTHPHPNQKFCKPAAHISAPTSPRAPRRSRSCRARVRGAGSSDDDAAPAKDKVPTINVAGAGPKGKPLFHYVSLAKKLLAKSESVEIRGVGFAIARVVSVVEILKTEGLAAATSIETGSVANDRAKSDVTDRPKPTVSAKLRRVDDIMRKMEKMKTGAAPGEAAA